jgi:uncharacterized membrane protein YgdD (TMEM256/DUF423 family)
MRLWLFIAGVLGVAAIAAGLFGAHVLRTDGFSIGVKNFETGVMYHGFHVLAILGVAAMLGISEGRRRAFAAWTLHAAGVAFAIGVVLFSGGLYAQTTGAIEANPRIVPYGGLMFVIGWAALAISAFGVRRANG